MLNSVLVCLQPGHQHGQRQDRIHGNPMPRGNFLDRLDISTTAQPLSSPVSLCCKTGVWGWVRKKGKEWSLQWGLQHLYLRVCLTPLFLSPLQSISCQFYKASLMQRQCERMPGWPLCLHRCMYYFHFILLFTVPWSWFFAYSFTVYCLFFFLLSVSPFS